MAMKDEIERLNRIIGDQEEKISSLCEDLREQQEELQHYRTALAAVKWLWDKAQEQTPFQI